MIQAPVLVSPLSVMPPTDCSASTKQWNKKIFSRRWTVTQFSQIVKNSNALLQTRCQRVVHCHQNTDITEVCVLKSVSRKHIFYHKSTITVCHTRVKPDTEICVVEVGNRSIFKLSRNWNFTKQMYAHMLTQGHAQTHMKTQACRDSITWPWGTAALWMPVYFLQLIDHIWPLELD